MAEDNKFEPRLYQLNARDQIIHGFEQDDKTVFLVLLPTGMGKTYISTLTIEMLLERDLIATDEKVLFLVQDRKLKHQLYDMAKKYRLAEHGYLFLLDDQKALPPQMARQHASLAKFIFATPILLMNALTGKVKRIEKTTLEKIKVVVIDEILDIFAQSYGRKRPRKEVIDYIERKFGRGRLFSEIIRDLKQELEASQTFDYEIDENRLADHVIREFSYQNYRLNKNFEPILQELNLIDSDSKRLIIGLTASMTQDAKIDLLKRSFGGEVRVTEIHPLGDDFEDYKPAYKLRRIRVFDEGITKIDAKISEIKRSLMRSINTAYKLITGRSKIPVDRILLFITDLLAKKKIQEKLLEQIGGNQRKTAIILSSAKAYLLMTVARQRLLESTFQSFSTFIHKITNRVLLANTDFTLIKQESADRVTQTLPDEKEKRLLYWLNRFTKEKQSVLVLCRFVEMTKHLNDVATRNGILSTSVHGRMDGSTQYARIKAFKSGDAQVLFASERLIEKGTDLPEADVGIYYGTTVSLERYEQSLGRIRSSVHNIKTFYTISYNQTVEDEKALKRDTMFMELIGKQLDSMVSTD